MNWKIIIIKEKSKIQFKEFIRHTNCSQSQQSANHYYLQKWDQTESQNEENQQQRGHLLLLRREEEAKRQFAQRLFSTMNWRRKKKFQLSLRTFEYHLRIQPQILGVSRTAWSSSAGKRRRRWEDETQIVGGKTRSVTLSLGSLLAALVACAMIMTTFCLTPRSLLLFPFFFFQFLWCGYCYIWGWNGFGFVLFIVQNFDQFACFVCFHFANKGATFS